MSWTVWGSNPSREKGFISPKCPDQQGQTSLLLSKYQGLLPRGKAAGA